MQTEGTATWQYPLMSVQKVATEAHNAKQGQPGNPNLIQEWKSAILFYRVWTARAPDIALRPCQRLPCTPRAPNVVLPALSMHTCPMPLALLPFSHLPHAPSIALRLT